MTTIDISTPADAGFWREALAWVGFRVADFEPVDDVPGDHPNGDRFAGPLPFNHDATDSREAQA